MRFFNFGSSVLVAFGAAAVFSACSHETDYYDPNFNPNKAQYEENWKNTFGEVNPEQDWNLAAKKSVTVSVSEPSTVCIFAENGDANSLVAQFEDFNGSNKVEFDVAEAVEKVIVMKKSESGYAAKTVKIGETADFTGTRGVYVGTNGDITVAETEDYKEFTKDETIKFYSTLPEGENSLNKVTQNFTFVSTGRFIIYPTYWASSHRHTVGIYYRTSEGIKEIDLFTNKDQMHYISFDGTSWQILNYNFSEKDNNDALHWGLVKFKTKGAVVDIPAGTIFGMYIKYQEKDAQWNDIDVQLYSEKELNNDSYDEDGKDVKEKAAHGATFELDGVRYVGFEDWPGKDSDKDFNDIICQIYGSEPTVLDEDKPSIDDDKPSPAQWILACEDLGGSNDFDFNDIVFKVSHVSGETKAYVTALEAGGTLPATIYYDNGTPDNTADDVEIGEIHALLGVGTDVMTTTGDAAPTMAGGAIEINVPETFSIGENMGGFYIKVVNGEETTTTVNAPGKGDVPQIICVPATWKAPKERTRISDAYPAFGEWGANWQNSDWPNSAVTDKLLNR